MLIDCTLQQVGAGELALKDRLYPTTRMEGRSSTECRDRKLRKQGSTTH